MIEKDFWKTKTPEDFSVEEWEAVCMHCGKCCLFKWQKKDRIYFSNLCCNELDIETGLCRCYEQRLNVSGCRKVTPQLLKTQPELLPEGCAYRVLTEQGKLPDCHPLVTGDKDSVRKAGMSVVTMPVQSAALRQQAVRQLRQQRHRLTAEEFDEKAMEIEIKFPLVFLEDYAVKP